MANFFRNFAAALAVGGLMIVAAGPALAAAGARWIDADWRTTCLQMANTHCSDSFSFNALQGGVVNNIDAISAGTTLKAHTLIVGLAYKLGDLGKGPVVARN